MTSKKKNWIKYKLFRKKYWVTHELQGTDMSSTNKGAGTYNSKKGVFYEWKKDLEESLRRKNISLENLFTFPSIIQRIMQTHGGSFSNSFSTCTGQQIQMDTSWLRSRRHKFTDIGNSIFLQERSSTGTKFWEIYSLFTIFP